MFYKANAVSQCPSVLLVQNTGITIDLINWSWDKIQLCSAITCRVFAGCSHDFTGYVVRKGKHRNEWVGHSSGISDWQANGQNRISIKHLGKIFSVTDTRDAIIAKHVQWSKFYFLFPLSAANMGQETNQISNCYVVLREIILFNIVAFRRIWCWF